VFFGKQSWFLSALFILMLLNSSETIASEKIASDPVWSLLLHSWQDKPQITDPKFLLSADNFAEQTELSLTLKLYKTDPKKAFCRYPARITYLSGKLGFKLAEDRYTHCQELQKFLHYVPFQQLDLVFASEVLSSASSMMGHIFLKASGNNFRNVPVAHSLAYFTEITTLNPAKLIVESTMTGMPGFFSVRPFDDDLTQYKEKEQRNVWQLKLNATAEKLHLLQLHVWELNQIELTYYFQSFNCATLTLEMLALLNPNILAERGLIVSPVDVVKAATTHHMISNTEVNTADLWLYSALRDSMPNSVLNTLDNWIYTQSDALTPAKAHPLAVPYLNISLDHAAKRKQITTAKAAKLRKSLSTKPEIALNLTHYKHPALTPQDSAVGISWRDSVIDKKLLFHFLPTGHFLYGDNRQYLSESELQIAKTTLAWDIGEKQLLLDEFTIYAVRSLNPDTELFPLWSGEFYLGYQPVYTANLALKSVGEISGAIGKSYTLHKDMISFVMLGAGSTSTFDTSHAFIYSKAGVSMNLALDTKLITEYSTSSGKMGSDSRYQQLSAVISWFPSRNRSVSFRFAKTKTKSSDHTDATLEFFSYF
jgi:hypothetical protein